MSRCWNDQILFPYRLLLFERLKQISNIFAEFYCWNNPWNIRMVVPFYRYQPLDRFAQELP
jgi:hypothetical protein